MLNNRSKSTQFMPGWPNSHAPRAELESVKTTSIHEEYLDTVPLNELQQGELYIIKIKLIAIALFQGWDDEMCCFSILRTDLLEDLRWSEARYLPENFDAYLAFDYAGNPPIHLWTKQLRAVIPINWFNIFEEARHFQRQWNVSFWDQPAIENRHAVITDMAEEEQEQEEDEKKTKFYNLSDTPVPQENDDDVSDEFHNNDDETQVQEQTEVAPKEYRYYSSSQSKSNPNLQQQWSESPMSSKEVSQEVTTPAMQLQKQYNVTQQQQQTTSSKPTVTKSATTISTIKVDKRPEIKQRRSFSSFFLKKKKSKKSLNEDVIPKKESNRKSAPPTPSLDDKYNKKKSLTEDTAPPALTTSSSNSSTDNQIAPEVKTPKNEPAATNKVELFDVDSYFDMQATFAFLNNTTEQLTIVNNAKPTVA